VGLNRVNYETVAYVLPKDFLMDPGSSWMPFLHASRGFALMMMRAFVAAG
jgi:hypothetical protein